MRFIVPPSAGAKGCFARGLMVAQNSFNGGQFGKWAGLRRERESRNYVSLST
jgi:hypothetical protein